MRRERSRWDPVAKLMEAKSEPVRLGRYLAYWFDRSPRRALHYMSYYKFAAKLIGKGRSVLDVGCSEGMGTWLLAKECGWAKGVDFDAEAVSVARGNWTDPSIEFECADILKVRPGRFGGVTSFDVIEHILPRNAGAFLRRLAANLGPDGVAVVGTPNIESDRFASPVTRKGHVNLYSAERLEASMRKEFQHVFMFAANDELVHTGFMPLAHYLIAVGCGPRRKPRG